MNHATATPAGRPVQQSRSATRRPWPMALVLGLALLLAWPLFPASSTRALAQPVTSSIPLTPQQTELLQTPRFKHLADELRCLVCQNQTLLDSNAPLAQDLRNEVVRLMDSGRDDEAIRSYLVDRYGEFVLYKPTLSARNALLWFGPGALLLLAALVWWQLGRRRRAPSAATSPAATPPADSTPRTAATAQPAETVDEVRSAQARLDQIDALLRQDPGATAGRRAP